MKSDTLRNHLDQVWSLLEKAESSSKHHPVLLSNIPETVRKKLDTQLPYEGDQFGNVLGDFESQILPFINRNTDARFGAYITGSGNKVAALAEFIKGYYNQNGLKWNNSPIASELEQLVIQWVAEFCELSDLTKGVITSGGSMSNLLGIHFALARKFPAREMSGLLGAPKFTIYCSNQTHSSVDRAMVFLGLGRNQIRKIGVNPQYEIDLKELRITIEQDLLAGFQPLMIIGNAGTTNTGSIDDLKGLAKLAGEFDLWYHVDGAYGLPARRLPELAKEFDGIDLADSIVINPHKWMYVTFEASCILLKEIPQAIHFSPDYLFTEDPGVRWESSEHTIELSKEFRALKIWFTLKYYGANQLTDFVRQDIAMIGYLADSLKKNTFIRIDPHHPLSILCFRWNDPKLPLEENERINIQAIRQIESQGKIFITGTKLQGKTHLRVYFGNPERTEKDVDQMHNEIMKVFSELVSV